MAKTENRKTESHSNNLLAQTSFLESESASAPVGFAMVFSGIGQARGGGFLFFCWFSLFLFPGFLGGRGGFFGISFLSLGFLSLLGVFLWVSWGLQKTVTRYSESQTAYKL